MFQSIAAQEALRQLQPIFDVDMSHPTILYEDNESALQLAHNPVHKDRTKHINIRYHFIRECISSLHTFHITITTVADANF